MSLGNIRNGILNPNTGTGISPSLDADSGNAMKEAEENAKEQSGASAAMNKLTQSIIANQLAHSINKAILNNAKTVAQQYLSIA